VVVKQTRSVGINLKVNIKSIVLLLFLLTIISTQVLSQQREIITFKQGLDAALEQYNSLEKSLIRRVAEKLAYNGFPIEKITRVQLKKSIDSDRAYYTNNEIIFIINPVIYKAGKYMSNVEAITLTWQDPSVIYHDDGSMEFEVGNHITAENLVLTLYGLKDVYADQVVLENQQVLLNKINTAFLSCECEDIKYITANGLIELSENHSIAIMESVANSNEYEVSIGRIGHGVFDDKHFNEVDSIYSIKVDLNKNSVVLLNKYYPSFFPTPAAMPRL